MRSIPQKWVNILGNVSPAASITSLSYTLNGGPSVPLRMGPDDLRLALPGDFNVQIDYSTLQIGNNQLVITAEDNQGGTKEVPVTVAYSTSGAAWVPGTTYTFDWSTVGKVTELAQPVDGEWEIDGDSVQATILDFDRLLAIGDASWKDYTVTVPITVYNIDPSGYAYPSTGPGVGILTRWQGHFRLPGEEAPYTGWMDLGALAWYRWRQIGANDYVEGLQLIGASNWNLGESEFPFTFGVTYNFKLKIESSATEGQAAYYQFKVWPASQAEPAAWTIQSLGNPNENQSGSLLLVAHHVDAEFGAVQVDLNKTLAGNGSTCTLNVNVNGNGTVEATPNLANYQCGTNVMLEATPEAGHQFAGWSGGITSIQNPINVVVNDNMAVEANFEPEQTYTLALSTDGFGEVTSDPEQTVFGEGETVTLTAVPGADAEFTGWSGDASGTTNPLTVVMDSDKDITANFTGQLYTLTVSVPDGGGTVATDPPGTQFELGQQVELTAIPNDGFVFDGWNGSVSSKANPYLLTITGDMTVVAHFVTRPTSYAIFFPSVIAPIE